MERGCYRGDTCEYLHLHSTDSANSASMVHSTDSANSSENASTVHSTDSDSTVHSTDSARTVHSTDSASKVHSTDSASVQSVSKEQSLDNDQEKIIKDQIYRSGMTKVQFQEEIKKIMTVYDKEEDDDEKEEFSMSMLNEFE